MITLPQVYVIQTACGPSEVALLFRNSWCATAQISGIRPTTRMLNLWRILPEHDSAACGAIAVGCEGRSGVHACKTARTVILDDLARLHADKADLAWVLPMLYIVARGRPVTTAAIALSLQGDMKRIPVASIREHDPQMKRRVIFCIVKALNVECPALASGLRSIEQMRSSCWRVQLADDTKAACYDNGFAPRQPAAPTQNKSTRAASSANNMRGRRAAPQVVAKSRGGRPHLLLKRKEFTYRICQ